MKKLIYIILFISFSTVFFIFYLLFSERNRVRNFRPLTTLDTVPNAIGRYIISFPKGSILIDWYQSIQGIGEITITTNKTQEDFDKMVEDQASIFRSIPHLKGGNRLIKVETLRLPNGKIIIYWKNELFKSNTNVPCKKFFYNKNTIYISSGTVPLDTNNEESYFRGFERTCAAIRSRRPDEIPTEPGTCFDGAILLNQPGLEYDDLVMVKVVWPDRPDVRFRFVVFGNGPFPDPPLLTRLRRAKAIPNSGVLRSQPKTVDGNVGEEHLERVTEDNGTVSHLFIWEAQGLPNRFDRPQLRLTMTTGNGKDAPQYSSLSDEDALKLWDAVLDSLRWRPTVPPTQPAS